MRQKGEYKEGKCWSSNRREGRRQGAKEPRYNCSGWCWHMRARAPMHLVLYCWSSHIYCAWSGASNYTETSPFWLFVVPRNVGQICSSSQCILRSVPTISLSSSSYSSCCPIFICFTFSLSINFVNGIAHSFEFWQLFSS